MPTDPDAVIDALLESERDLGDSDDLLERMTQRFLAARSELRVVKAELAACQAECSAVRVKNDSLMAEIENVRGIPAGSGGEFSGLLNRVALLESRPVAAPAAAPEVQTLLSRVATLERDDTAPPLAYTMKLKRDGADKLMEIDLVPMGAA